MQEVRLVKEGEERDVDDAYEWGRAAGATLFAQNAEISLEFPLGLQNLFNNREFREAMVIGGVLSDRIISLPVIVPTESSSRPESPGYDEDEDLLTSFESQSKKRLLAIQDRRNSQQAEIWSNGVVIALPQASEPKMVHPPKERNRCLCCRSTKIVSGGDAERRRRLRELLWFSLRLDKYYERPTHPFPFCRKCEKRLEEMENICENMKKLEEQYETCRKDLSKGVLEQLLTMGEVAKKVGAEDGAMDTDEDEDNIHPGKELLSKVDSVCKKTAACVKERPKRKIQRRLHTLQKRSLLTSGSASAVSAASDPDNLLQHTNEQRLYKCNDCDLKFTSEFSKARHKRTVHDKELPFPCKVCQKSFSRYDLLKVHERVHTGEKPYTCPECDKSFSHGSNLHDHIRCHTNEKPYNCSLCSVTYARIRSFKVHFSKEHPGEEISFVRVNPIKK